MKKIIENLLMIISGVALISNFIFICIVPPVFIFLVYIGYVILATGILLFILSIYAQRRKRSTKITTYGVYGLIRNPMYFSFMLMFFSHLFFSQFWLVIIGSLVGMFCTYFSIPFEEKQNIQRFGKDYEQYMRSVPRINILLGIIRYIRKRN